MPADARGRESPDASAPSRRRTLSARSARAEGGGAGTHRGGSVGHRGRTGVDEGAEHAQCRPAVTDDVMEPQKQPDPATIHTGHQPDLPGRPRHVQSLPADPLGRAQQIVVLAPVGKRAHPDVVREIERRVVDPDRAAEAAPRSEDALPKSLDPNQPPGERRSERVDAQRSPFVEQSVAVQDGESADILRPDRIRPEHQRDRRR